MSADRLMVYSTHLAVSFVAHIIRAKPAGLAQVALVVRVARDALEILAAVRVLFHILFPAVAEAIVVAQAPVARLVIPDHRQEQRKFITANRTHRLASLRPALPAAILVVVLDLQEAMQTAAAPEAAVVVLEQALEGQRVISLEEATAAIQPTLQAVVVEAVAVPLTENLAHLVTQLVEVEVEVEAVLVTLELLAILVILVPGHVLLLTTYL